MGFDARWVTEHRRALRHVTRDHAPGSDDRVIAHRDARQQNGAAPDPHVAPDSDRAAELEPGLAFRSNTRVVCGQDLHVGPDLRLVPDVDLLL